MGTQERRERERRRRRQDILDTARRLFWERGYAGTTMPEIAEAAQLAQGTLYLYFPSKGALYVELLFEGYAMLLERLGAQVARDLPPRERAGALIDAFLEFARDWPQYFDIIFFVLQREARSGEGEGLDPEQVERLYAREAACKAVAARLLQQAGHEGTAEELQRSVDAIWSMLVGTVFYFRKAGPERFAAVAGQARHLILRALFPEK